MTHWSNIAIKWPKVFVIVLIVLALFAPIIANDKPILVNTESGFAFPALEANNKSYEQSSIIIKPIISYGPNQIDKNNMNMVSPFDKQIIQNGKSNHWLGTDELGRDLLSMLIHACRTAVIVAFGAVFFSFIMGLLLGVIAGYWGNNKLQLKVHYFWSILLSLIIAGIYSFAVYNPYLKTSTAIPLFILVGLLSFLALNSLLKLITKKKIQVPIDRSIQFLIEWLDALPLMFVIIGISAFLDPSLFNLIILIALFGWTSTARFARAEVLRLKKNQYVESGRALGFHSFRILFYHILPNAKSTLLTSLAFSMAAAIGLESTLSFLGIGLEAEASSWGSIIAAARTNLSAWWLVLFPGLFLFLSIFSFNKLAEEYSK